MSKKQADATAEIPPRRLYSFLHPNRRRVQTPLEEGSITQSEFKRESDINYLVEKHVKAGIPFPQHSIDDYRDVASLPDFQAAQDMIVRAREVWYGLDPKIRRHFGDKPENFLSALEDESRVDELVKLKVFKKPAEKAPQAPSQGSQGVPEPKAKGGAEPPAQ